MKESARIVMEETGCDEGQAELALQQTANNIEKAIKAINSLLRHIMVIKGKFFSSASNYYGIIILILNIKDKYIIRQAVTVSHDPRVYEEDLDDNWYSFERKLYSLRLKEGSNQELSHQIEKNMNIRLHGDYHHNFFQLVKEDEKEEFSRLFCNIISELLPNEGDLVIKLRKEELNLMQFKELKNEVTLYDKRKSFKWFKGEDHSGVILIDTDIYLHNGERLPRGRIFPVEKLNRNDVIYSVLRDNRDIAYYIWRLLGGVSENEISPLSTIVMDKRYEEGKWKIFTKFGPGIMGKVEIAPKTRVMVLKLPYKVRVNNISRILLIAGIILFSLLLIIYLLNS